MYPYKEGARFDLHYYRTTHMGLVKKHLKPFGILKTDVEKGISGGGDQAAPYIGIGNLYFNPRTATTRASQRSDRCCGGILPISPISRQFGKSVKFWSDFHAIPR